MRLKFLLSIFSLSCLFVLGYVHAQEPQDPEGDDETSVRGVFLKSRKGVSKSGNGSSGSGSVSSNSGFGAVAPTPRPVVVRATPKPTQRATPRPTPKPVAKASPKQPRIIGLNAGNKPPAATPPKQNDNRDNPPQTIPVALSESNIGLGYSLFLNNNDKAVRVDPAREFANGEQVRLMFEPNTDGYLYIFNTTNNGPATMLYPHPDLNGGNNKVSHNVPVFVPSASEGNEANQWFGFFGASGTEQLYVVVTRTPLKGFPENRAALNAYCTQNKDASGQCGVDKALWASVKAFDQKEKVLIAQNKRDIGSIASAAELPAGTGTRQIGLAPKDPPPTLIFMNASADRSVLFTKLELAHR